MWVRVSQKTLKSLDEVAHGNPGSFWYKYKPWFFSRILGDPYLVSFCLTLFSHFVSKYNERSKEKPPKSKILIFFARNKFYIVYSVYVIDFMVKNAMYKGFWTKIDIWRIWAAQNGPKLLNMAIFELLASAKYSFLSKTLHTMHSLP